MSQWFPSSLVEFSPHSLPSSPHLQEIDLEGFLTLPPNTSQPWHQDLAYWPPLTITPDPRTITFSLSLDNMTKPLGGIRYVHNSGRVKQLRNHSSLTEGLLSTNVDPLKERVKYAEVRFHSFSNLFDNFISCASCSDPSWICLFAERVCGSSYRQSQSSPCATVGHHSPNSRHDISRKGSELHSFSSPPSTILCVDGWCVSDGQAISLRSSSSLHYLFLSSVARWNFFSLHSELLSSLI